MTALKRLTLTSRLISLYSLLTKTNELYLITRLSNHDMALGRVTWRFLRLIKTFDSSSL
jgi:hypothetical protein